MTIKYQNKPLECGGGCEEHKGEVVPVTVSGNGWSTIFEFNYCESAIEYDKNNGWIVIIKK